MASAVKKDICAKMILDGRGITVYFSKKVFSTSTAILELSISFTTSLSIRYTELLRLLQLTKYATYFRLNDN